MQKSNLSGTFNPVIQVLPTMALPLVNKFYKLNKARGKAKGNDRVWVVKNTKEIIAAARVVDIAGQDFLTTVLVAEHYQGQGVASELITEIIKVQIKPLFTFPYVHLMSWYVKLGFEAIEVQALPKPLLQRFGRYQSQGRDIIAAGYYP